MAYKIKGEVDIEFGLGLPRHTTIAREAYAPAVSGYQVYDTDTNSVWTWNGTIWVEVSGGNSSAKADKAVPGTVGDFAALDVTGNLIDSGFSSGDFATFAQGALADTALQNLTATSIGTLSDVTITTAAADNFLVWDGSAWVNRDILAADVPNLSATYVDLTTAQTIAGVKTFSSPVLAPATVGGDSALTLTTKGYVDGLVGAITQDLAGLTDTTITLAETGDFLRYNGTAWVDHILVAADITDGATVFATGAEGDLASTAVQPADLTAALADYVELTGDQTIAGVKTFTSPVSGVTPVAVGDLTTKAYVDAAIVTGATLELDDLTDVAIVAAATGDFLRFDGTNWVDHVLVAADLTDGATVFATGAEGDLASTAVQPGDATSLLTNNDAFVDLTTAQTIAGAKTFTNDAAFSGDVTVTGDLIVNGTTTTVNSTNLDIADSIITLNVGETGAGVTAPAQSGLKIERGTETDTFLIWDEASDTFGQAFADGSGDVDLATFEAFALASDVSASSYQEVFNTGDWTAGTPNTYVVTAATHGIPYSENEVFIVQVYEADGSLVSIETTVNQTNGTVTLSTAGATFNGRIIISK